MSPPAIEARPHSTIFLPKSICASLRLMCRIFRLRVSMVGSIDIPKVKFCKSRSLALITKGADSDAGVTGVSFFFHTSIYKETCPSRSLARLIESWEVAMFISLLSSTSSMPARIAITIDESADTMR